MNDNINNNSPEKSAEPAAALPHLGNTGALPKHRIKTDVFDVAALVLNFLLTFFFIRSVICDFSADIITTASYLGIFVLATAFIAVKQKKINNQAILTGVMCVALSLSFALRDNPFEISFLAVIALIYLSGSYCIALTESNRHSRGSYFFFFDVLKTEVFLPVKHLFLPYSAMLNTKKTNKTQKADANGKKTDRKYLAVIIGVICALPVLLIVVPLLIKSDAAFESVTGSFFEKINSFFSNLEKSFGSFGDWLSDNTFFFLPTVFVAPYIFSVMFSFRYGVSNEENKDTSKKYEKLRIGSPALFSGFFGVICLVYVAYILSQAAYFFSAFGGKLPDGTDISLAQYARRGFFELAGVAALNLILIAVTVLFSRRDGGKFKTVIKVFDLFLCAFNVLLSFVSMSKIMLYMNEMGLTHKRIYVFLFDIVLIVAFVCVAVRLLNEKFPYMRVITVTACVLFVALSLVGIDGIIANYNTEKYLKGEIESESLHDLMDGNSFSVSESYIKLAESETPMKEDAYNEIISLVCGSESAYNKDSGESLYDFVLEDDKIVRTTTKEYALNIDAAITYKILNANIETVKKALEYKEKALPDTE